MTDTLSVTVHNRTVSIRYKTLDRLMWVLAFTPLIAPFFFDISQTTLYPLSGVVIFYWVWRLLDPESVPNFFERLDLHYPTKKDGLLTIAVILVTFVIEITILNVGYQILETTPSAHQSVSGMNLTDPLLIIGLIILFFLFVGPLEELIFRYGIQRKLLGSFSIYTRIGLTSVLFSVAHFWDYGGGLGSMLPLVIIFVSSCIYGYAYEYSDNLTVPTLAHSASNSIAVLFVFFGI